MTAKFDDPIFDELLTEYVEHRKQIKILIADLEHLRTRVETILPETYDKRYRFIFEEKIKAITILFSTILEMRKEIAKSIKDEFELRKKLVKSDALEDLEDMLDVRKIARKVDEFRKDKDQLEQTFEKLEKQKEEKEGIIE
jgi:hypothetical protein